MIKQTILRTVKLTNKQRIHVKRRLMRLSLTGSECKKIFISLFSSLTLTMFGKLEDIVNKESAALAMLFRSCHFNQQMQNLL